MLYGMKRVAAMDPECFSKVDLNDYRDRLSRADIKELTALQTSASSDAARRSEPEGDAVLPRPSEELLDRLSRSR